MFIMPFQIGHPQYNTGHTRFKKGQNLGEEHWNWKGGKQKTGNGYVHLYMPNHPNADNRGRIFEHRVVMEKKMGRYLRKAEVIHHINGIRSDNRVNNLRLYTSNGDHISDELSGKIPKFIPSHKGYKHSAKSKR